MYIIKFEWLIIISNKTSKKLNIKKRATVINKGIQSLKSHLTLIISIIGKNMKKLGEKNVRSATTNKIISGFH